MPGPGLWGGSEASTLEVLEVTLRGDPMCLDAWSPVPTLQPRLGFLELAWELPDRHKPPPTLVQPSTGDPGI